MGGTSSRSGAPAPAPTPAALLVRSEAKAKPQAKSEIVVTASTSHSMTCHIEKLPCELLNMVLDNITDKRTLAKLCRTSKSFYHLTMPRIHYRAAVVSMLYPQIIWMMQTVQRYLSIKQKRKLRELTQSAGEQKTYLAEQGEDKIPEAAGHVRELIIGPCSPGGQRNQYVHRYVEEFVKNLTHIQALEIQMDLSCLFQPLPLWDSVKALSISTEDPQGSKADCLQNVRNLEHLCLKSGSYPGVSSGFHRGLLRRSASTLKTLTLYSTGLNAGVQSIFDATTDSHGNVPKFTSLHSVDFSNFWTSKESVYEMLRVVDFTSLSSIKLAFAEGAVTTLYRQLSSAFAAAEASPWDKAKLKTQELEVDTSFNYDRPEANDGETAEAHLSACFSLIGSFSELQSLVVGNFGMYPVVTNPNREPVFGLPSELIAAILKHRHLKTLELTIRDGANASVKFPSAENINAIIRGLPELEHIGFSAYEWNMEETTRCLTHGHFSSIDYNPRELFWVYQRDEPRWLDAANTVRAILFAYLEYDGPDDWDAKMDKLRNIFNQSRQWQVSRGPFTPARGAGTMEQVIKAAQMMTSKDGNRSLWYREVAVCGRRDFPGYDPSLRWMDRVSKAPWLS